MLDEDSMLKPTFISSKVAALINMNPYEKVFDVVYDCMARHRVPLGVQEEKNVIVNTGQVYLAEKQALEKHLKDLVEPHVKPSTTVKELQAVERNLSVLGPLGQQAASFARMRFGQLQEHRAVHTLQAQGKYGRGDSKTIDMTHFYLTGKTDGSFNGDIVEIKNRTRRFLGVTEYERPQFECYMRIFNKKQLYLCERLGEQERKMLVFADDDLWDTILKRLTWVSQFMGAVQEQPFLQQLSKDDLEFQFHRFIAERVKLVDE